MSERVITVIDFECSNTMIYESLTKFVIRLHFAFSSSDGPENPQTDVAQAVSAKWTVPAWKDI